MRDSPSRHRFVDRVYLFDRIIELDEEREPYPTLRERPWITVGWPTASKEGFWVAEFDPSWYDIQRKRTSRRMIRGE